MAKLYWAEDRESDSWRGPHSSVEECVADACDEHFEPGSAIWVAPIDAECDDDEKFWDTVADNFLRYAENVDETLAEDGWIDHEDTWLPSIVSDRDRILARALREVLGPRPAWRTVDTEKAERVEL